MTKAQILKSAQTMLKKHDSDAAIRAALMADKIRVRHDSENRENGKGLTIAICERDRSHISTILEVR
jgi:hypothetical protein